MNQAITLARERPLHRVQLTVVADNHRAIRLYEKVGFQREGLKRENYLGEDGKCHDEVEMGILLGFPSNFQKRSARSRVSGLFLGLSPICSLKQEVNGRL